VRRDDFLGIHPFVIMKPVGFCEFVNLWYRQDASFGVEGM
jgi:hypothetical protein